MEEKKQSHRNLQTHISNEDYEKWEEIAAKTPHGSVFGLLKYLSGQYLRGELVSGEELNTLKNQLEIQKLKNQQLEDDLTKVRESLQTEIENRKGIYNRGLADGQKLIGVLKAKANQYDKVYQEIKIREDGCGLFGNCLCKSKEIHTANEMIKGLETFQSEILGVLQDRV